MDIDIPQEIIECADKVDMFFKMNGIEGWQLNGIASRSLVNENYVNPPHFDSMDITPEMSLREALGRARTEQPNASLTIFLWNEGAEYNTAFYNAGMSTSQMVSLLEVIKHRVISSLVDDEE